MPSTRRELLASAVAGSAALAGCSTLTRLRSPPPDDPPPSGVDEHPDPDKHVFGANGRWSSFGCNAANTRAVGDGKGPVDGVTERWRVEVAQLGYQEPVVADGRVYHPGPSELRVFDAADGTELWTLEDAHVPPILRDDVVYTAVGTTIYALEPATGDVVWEREFDVRGSVTPTLRTRLELVCGIGEEVVSLEPDDGSVQWRRDVFGQILEHAAAFGPWGIAVATDAGMLYQFTESGRGVWRWQLPARPMCSPTAGRDAIYVACDDGTTYALSDRQRDVAWTADTGWTERGIGVADGLVLVAARGRLQALDPDSGDRHWAHEIDNAGHTAPAYGRDTVFVGGDRLWALDPTPGDSPDGGPAVRFEQEFAGRVGPGPVLHDGTLYVVAQVDDETYALLALE